MNIQRLNISYFNQLNWILAQRKIRYDRQSVIIKRGGRYLNYMIQLLNPLALDDCLRLAEPTAMACNSTGVIIQRQLGYLSIQIAIPESYWLQYYRGQEVTGLGVGMTDDKQMVEYNFNSNSSLIAGTTGSGKSFCGFASVLALCESFTPDELGVVLVDPHRYFDSYKSANESYVTFRNESHILNFDYGDVAYTDEQIEQAINYVYQESKRRLQNQIVNAGHLLLVIDEADYVLQKCLGQIQFIAKESRKVNVHLMVMSQEPTKANIPIRDLLGNRFIGKQEMRKTEVTSLIGAPVDARNLTMDGHDFFHVESGNIQRFTVVKLRQQDFDKLERGNQKNVDSVIELKSVGRPKKKLDKSLLAYLWLVGPDRFSDSLISKHWGIYHERVAQHKQWIRDFGQCYLQMKNLAHLNNDLHPKNFFIDKGQNVSS